MKRIGLFSLSIGFAVALASLASRDSKADSAPADSSTPAKSATTAFEGFWNGQDVTPGQSEAVTLKVSGHALEYRGADTNDWLEGTFTLKEDTAPRQFIGIITNCASPDDIGKKCLAIYKLENGTLTITGNAPGDPNFPAAFDAPGARQFVFKIKK